MQASGGLYNRLKQGCNNPQLIIKLKLQSGIIPFTCRTGMLRIFNSILPAQLCGINLTLVALKAYNVYCHLFKTHCPHRCLPYPVAVKYGVTQIRVLLLLM